jgi:hypothetical protein
MNFTQALGQASVTGEVADKRCRHPWLEAGKRRVTPDDLTALAVALGVSPITLVMPEMPGADDPVAMVEVTGVGTAFAFTPRPSSCTCGSSATLTITALWCSCRHRQEKIERRR